MDKLIRSRIFWFLLTYLPLFVVYDVVLKLPEFSLFISNGILEVIMLWIAAWFQKQMLSDYLRRHFEKFRYSHLGICVTVGVLALIVLVMSYDIEAAFGIRIREVAAHVLCLVPQIWITFEVMLASDPGK